MTNQNICVGVYQNYRCFWLKVVMVIEQQTLDGVAKKEDLAKEDVILDCSAFLCTSSYVNHMSSTVWRPFFSALLISYGSSLQHQNLLYLLVHFMQSAVQCPPHLTQQHDSGKLPG